MSTDALPRMLNCGHMSTPDGLVTGIAYLPAPGGIERPGDEDYTLCYDCAGHDTVDYHMTVFDTVTLYLGGSDNSTVCTWPGFPAGRVTRYTRSATRVNVQVRDPHGRMWHGTGPRDWGTYVTLRAYKGK